MKFTTLIAGALLMASAGFASASVIYADEVLSVNKGVCEPAVGVPGDTVDNCLVDRDNPDNALGAPNDDFYSLGFGGEIVLGFGQDFTGSNVAAVFEVTFDRDVGHDEAVELFAVNGDDVESIAILTNSEAEASALIKVPFTALKLVDVTKTEFPNSTSFDGFDVASVGISEVPLPAAGLMLLMGLGGFAAMRRKS